MGKGNASTDQIKAELVKSQEPIVIQIKDSVLVEHKHRISFAVANQTIHGVYIELLQLEKPKDTKFIYLEWVKDHDHGGPGFTPMMWSERQWTPKYIPPGEDVYFAISFPQIKNSKTPDSESGELKITFSRLEKTKVENKKYAFRIRF